jgi:hypothetical protein
VVSRQRGELNATVVEQRAGTYQQRINRLLGKPRKGRINVTAGGGLEDFDLLPDGQGRSLNVRDKGLCEGEDGIDQHANAHGSRLQLMQQSKFLCPKLSNDKRDTVTLPPGRLRLATRPSLTGSPPLAKTIGIVVVAALATIDEGVSCAAITVT